MRTAGSPDAFIVINGPQDGAEFPIVDREVKIGQEHECAVRIQLDRNVQPLHAIATATGDGYRIRAASGTLLKVDGKSVGRLRSRLLKAGEVLTVGYTDLVLEIAPDGMARRSKGVKMPSDMTWAVRGMFKGLFGMTDKLGRFLMTIPKFMWRHKFLTIIGILIASQYIPGLNQIVSPIIDRIRSFISQLTN